MQNKVVHFQIGKNKINNNLIENIRKTLEKNKSARVSYLKSSGRTHKSIDEDIKVLEQKLGNRYVIKRIGFTLVIRKFRKPVR